MFKRIATLFLVTVLCLGCMTSCFIVIDERTGRVEPPATEGETFAPIVRPEALPDTFEELKKKASAALEEAFETVDYAEDTFTVVFAYDDSVSVKAYQESSYTRALKIQEELIEEKFNCKLIINRISYNTLVSDAQASMNAGLHYADVVCFPQSGLGYLKQHKLIAELSALYGDALDDPIFDANAKKSASAKNGVYAIGGSACVNPAAYGCVYLNKELSDEYGFTDEILALVENGGWTIDAMLSYKEKLTAHPDAVSVAAKSDSLLINSLFGASGMKFMNSDPAGVPVIADNGTAVDDLTAKLRAFVTDTAICTFNADAVKVFERDNALFLVDTLASSSKIKGSYVVLPLPKANADQSDYVYYTNGNTSLFGVLTTNTRAEYALSFIKAFNITGELVSEAWAKDLIDYVLREPTSYNTVKKMFSVWDYDPVYMYGDVYPSLKAATTDSLKSAVLSDQPYSFYSNQQVWNVSRDMNILFQ